MITYTWDILSLTKKDFPNLDLKDVVVEVVWKKTGKNEAGDTYEYQCHSSVAPPTQAEGFKDLDDLTEEQIVEWVVANIHPDAMRSIDEAIEKALTEPAVEGVVVPWLKKAPTKKSKKGSK